MVKYIILCLGSDKFRFELLLYSLSNFSLKKWCKHSFVFFPVLLLLSRKNDVATFC
jgi:hypothetical protein